MKKVIFAYLVVLIVGLTACFDDHELTCEQKESFASCILEKPKYWKVTSYVFEANEEPVPGLNDSCTLESRLIFDKGTLTEPYGCGGFLADSGSYEVIDCGAVLHLNTRTFPNTDFQIKKLTGDELIVTFPYGPYTLKAYARAYYN